MKEAKRATEPEVHSPGRTAWKDWLESHGGECRNCTRKGGLDPPVHTCSKPGESSQPELENPDSV